MTRIERYRYPADPPPWPGCADVKRHAARAARARCPKARAKAVERLEAALNALDTASVGLWASVVMIDNRWCGATGEGAYWAVASRLTNEAAQRVLKRRPMFQVMERTT